MAGHTDLSVFVAASPDEVWRTANDIESWPELFDGEYASAQVQGRDTDRIRFRLTMVPLEGRVHSWVSERYLDAAARTVVARRVDTGPFRYVHIFQSFLPTEGGTVMRWVQDFEVRPDAPFTDEQMEARIRTGAIRNLARHKRILEDRAGGARPGDVRDTGTSAGHVDVRVLARAPIDVVWAVANDRAAWARSGHPVTGSFDAGTESHFDVTTPPDGTGRSMSFRVHRIRDDEHRTVFSRRYDSEDFLYSTQWFGYEEVAGGTEMRCVADFQTTGRGGVGDAEMGEIMTAAMSANLTQLARVAESSSTLEVS